METETKNRKIYEPETIDEEELPEGIIWETIVDKPTTLSELSAADGERLDTVETEVTNGFADVAIQGWMFDGAMSATDHDTVAWASGTLRFTDGTTYSITGGNTGTMAAITYIYFDLAVSTTAFQTTTTAANAVGTNKLLVGVAQNVASGKSATFQAFGGKGGVGVLLTADNIAANSITANEIQTNTITSLTLTSGTITGALIRTSSSGARVIMDDSIDALRIYDASRERMRLDQDELIFYDGAGDVTGTLGALYSNIFAIVFPSTELGMVVYSDTTAKFAVGNTSIVCYDELDMQSQDIVNVSELVWASKTGSPNRDGEMFYYSSGGTQQMRLEMNTVDFTFDLSFL